MTATHEIEHAPEIERILTVLRPGLEAVRTLRLCPLPCKAYDNHLADFKKACKLMSATTRNRKAKPQ